MDAVAITIGVAWSLAAVLCIGLATPLLRGKVKRNPVYGVRTARSLDSDEAWLAINRFWAKRMIAWSIPILAVALATPFLPLQSRPAIAMLLGLGPLVFILIPCVETWRFARQYKVEP